MVSCLCALLQCYCTWPQKSEALLCQKMDLFYFHDGLRNLCPTGSKMRMDASDSPTEDRRTQRSETDLSKILQQVSSDVEPQGFEAHPFLIGWYNDVVEEHFRLNYPPNTPAILLLSTPSMFEKSFIPFLLRQDPDNLQDPVDRCMVEVFAKLREENGGAENIDVIHDFELHPNRRPKLLVQSAAHVSGAAFLYHTKNIPSTDSTPRKKMMGLCLHPKYGGWFAIRGCLIFKNLTCDNLARKDAHNVLTEPADQLKAVELFNYHWRDCRFRDAITVQEQYSELQQRFFNTPSGDRGPILKEIIAKYSN